MRKVPLFMLPTFSPFVASGAYPPPLPPQPQPVCMPASQAQAIVSWLSQASPLQAQIIEAAQARDHEAAIIAKAKAEQKLEDDAAKAAPGKP